MDDWKGTILRAVLLPLVFTALILKEPDLGTGMVCVAVTALMLYLAGAQVRYFAIGAAFAAAGAVLHAVSCDVPADAHAGVCES